MRIDLPIARLGEGGDVGEIDHHDCHWVGADQWQRLDLRRPPCLARRWLRDSHAGDLDAAPSTPLAHEIGVQTMRQRGTRDRRAGLIAVGQNLGLELCAATPGEEQIWST